MSEVERIRDQLRRSYEGQAWHGPALGELLAGIDAERAGARPVAGAHTIREIVRHLVTWTEVARRRVEGERVDSMAAAEDWPPSAGDATGWEGDLGRLEASQTRLLEAVGRLEDDRLEDMVPEAGYSLYFQLHGIIQHQLYHAGQIALLVKGGARARLEETPSGVDEVGEVEVVT